MVALIEVNTRVDDYWHEVDKQIWTEWINARFNNPVFTIRSHPIQANLAVIQFQDSNIALLFQLSAPEYAEDADIQKLRQFNL